VPRRLKTVPPLRQTAGAGPERDELSREASAASLPELPEATAELIGWVTGDGQVRPTAALRDARRVLAAALGVPDAALERMRDEDVGSAVDRLRSLVDQCLRLAGQVTIDELTGALRRGAGLAALQREMDRARRVPGKGLVVIFVDVDGLKTTNDRAGHAAGDERLRAIVAAISERLRSYDLIIRYGGDEFLCVLTDSGVVEAEGTAVLLQDHVQRRTGGTVSVGIAELAVGETVGSLVDRADANLYAGRRDRARTQAPPAGR